MKWEFHTFQTLDTRRLFEFMKLRTDVFVVEQQCAYPELDSFDNRDDTIHLLGFDQQTLAAYARAMPISEPAEANYSDVVHDNGNANDKRNITAVKIGRVVVIKSHRGTGLAEQLMNSLLSQLEKTYPGKDHILSAQVPIVSFYEALGFKTESAPYLEDGIPHIDMRRSSGLTPAEPRYSDSSQNDQ
jgi:ElaA protein